jgi:hypothetical protein
MPGTFTAKNAALDVTTSFSTAYTAPASTTSTIVSCLVTNHTTTSQTFDCRVNNGTAYYIANDILVEAGGTLKFITKDAPILLEATDYMEFLSSATTSLDAVLMIVEET